MGDMRVASFAIDNGREADWQAAHRAVDAIDSVEGVINPDWFELGSGEDEKLAELREALHADLGELEQAVENYGRHLTCLTVRGVDVYLTGGLTSGDPPTDLYEGIERLHNVGGILEAAGFDVDSEGGGRFNAFTYDELLWLVLALTMAKVECAQGHDPVLTAMVDEAAGSLPRSLGAVGRLREMALLSEDEK